MAAVLLEREHLLAELDGALSRAAAGDGALVLVAGEAGAGKTSLVRAFAARHADEAVVWWGGCDALLTPSPLQPLYDIARICDGELGTLLADGRDQREVFTGFLDLLVSSPRPVVVVVEDVHWADEATLDLLVFTARRLAGVAAVMVVTFRDDELDPEHPLRMVLGRIATSSQVHRLHVPLLSATAIATLAGGHRVDPARLFAVTGGNPFFAAELLAAPPDTIPETVRDAVLTRVRQLSREAQAALELVSLAPDGADLGLISAVTGRPAVATIGECERVGLVQLAGRTVTFRHELARQAVAQAVPSSRAPDLHGALLEQLALGAVADPARLLFHADQTGDRAAVLAHAPAAIAHASRLGAHRQAVAHCRTALRYAGDLPDMDRAELLEQYAEECGATGAQQDALDALARAAALRQRLGDSDGHARAMVRRAQFLYATGRGREAFDLVDRALALVADRPPGPAVAAVYAHAAYLHMVRDDRPRTLELGARAVALAEQFDDQVSLSGAWQAIGGVQWFDDPADAEKSQVRAVEAARASGRAAGVARATGGLGQGALNARRYRTADRWLAEAVDWCAQHDLDAQRDFYRAAQAESHFEQGRWSQASVLIETLVAPGAQTFPPAKVLAERIRCRLSVRRGDPDQHKPLAQAWQAATASGDLARLWPTAASMAESAWLVGRSEQIPELVMETFRLAVDRGHPWAIGELGYWLWRAGAVTEPPDDAAEPFTLHIRGQWTAAAECWDTVGCPYEAASARADSDDPDQLRTALESFYRLGARPAANRLVHRMRRLGITGLPRRPHRSTGANPAGLTDRELDVAAQLAAGLSNAAIAARLHISPRTAGHHVAAIMAKLEVPTRHDAARAAQALGIGGSTAGGTAPQHGDTG
jgi:DNA-binding CsgD family transcriptional regulator/tetratricopeptide (TPR) repeat protein